MEESILEIRIVDYITFLFEVKNGSQLDYLVYGHGYYKRKYTTFIFYPKGITLFDIKEDYYFECVPDYRIHQLKQLQEALTSHFYLQEVLITVEGKRYHPYFYATPSGVYGAYVPDAFGFSGNASFMGTSVELNLVWDKFNTFKAFGSYTGGGAYTGGASYKNGKLFSLGITMDFYHNNVKNKTVFDGILGKSSDYSVGYGIMTSYSRPEGGVGAHKLSFGLGTGLSIGEGRTYSISDINENNKD